MTQQTPSSRSSRAESQARTRERLIEAARQLLVSHGFGGTSIRDIAERAGFSQGAFYSNFSGKEDILLELLRRYMEDEAAQLSAVLDRSGDAADAMLAGLELWAAELDRETDWAMLSIELQLHAQRSPAFATAFQSVWDTHRQALGQLLTRLFHGLGRRLPADPAALAAGFMALAHGLALQRLSAPDEPGDCMLMVFLRGLIAGAAKDDAPDC